MHRTTTFPSISLKSPLPSLGWGISLLALCFALMPGCAHLGTRLVLEPPPENAPPVEEILADLAANDAAIAQFKARGDFILKTPELDTVYWLPTSDIYYQHPGRLFVKGRKHAHNVLMLRCEGEKFLIELPLRKEYIYRREGHQFAELATKVSPADIAQELFLPEDWAALTPKQVRVSEVDETQQTVSIEIYQGKRPYRLYRRLTLQGPPWRVLRAELLAPETQEVLAVTTKTDYHLQNDIRFASQIESTFPEQDAYMQYKMRWFKVNEPLDMEWVDIESRRQQLEVKGYQEIEAEVRVEDTK